MNHSVSLTIIKVKYSWVFWQAWVKISHQRGDVLSGCEHSVNNISCVDETCENKHVKDAVSHSYEMLEDIHGIHYLQDKNIR